MNDYEPYQSPRLSDEDLFRVQLSDALDREFAKLCASWIVFFVIGLIVMVLAAPLVYVVACCSDRRGKILHDFVWTILVSVAWVIFWCSLFLAFTGRI